MAELLGLSESNELSGYIKSKNLSIKSNSNLDFLWFYNMANKKYLSFVSLKVQYYLIHLLNTIKKASKNINQ